ncbi:hypothetical protein [Streptomyces sp. NPDC004589]|uniref:hypothetical protein n=2 Tax=unclassified Streptomyces TaxID=2593676 RepID=UPI0033BBA176
MVERPIVVEAPGGSGGRSVRVGDETLGTANSLHDLTVFLQCIGLVGWDELDVAESDLIEWHGGGPEVWPCQGGGPGCWAAPGEPAPPLRKKRRA